MYVFVGELESYGFSNFPQANSPHFVIIFSKAKSVIWRSRSKTPHLQTHRTFANETYIMLAVFFTFHNNVYIFFHLSMGKDHFDLLCFQT